MKQELVCINCPLGCLLTVCQQGEAWTVSGNACPRGEQYGVSEVTAPMRTVTSTITLRGGRRPLVPVKTSRPIPRELIFPCMEEIRSAVVQAPVRMGDVLLENAAGTGVPIIAACTIEAAQREDTTCI